VRSRRNTSSSEHGVVLLWQERAMPRFRVSEWIVPQVDVALFLLNLVCAAAILNG
jgi:hypothetical protein